MDIFEETRLIYVAGNAGGLIALFMKESYHDVKGIRAYKNGHLHGVLVQAMIPGSDFFFFLFFFCKHELPQFGISFLSGLNNVGGNTFKKAFL